jgi:hypothetical protein
MLVAAGGSFRKLRFSWLAACVILIASHEPFTLLAQDFSQESEDRLQQKNVRTPGFDYCPPPHPPGCIVQTSAKGKASADCEEDLQIYIQTVFAYRECLALETERAVRESNDVIDHWKCKKNASKRCK